jgi:hypothetical protein
MDYDECRAFSKDYAKDFGKARYCKKKFEKIFLLKPDIKNFFIEAPTIVKWYKLNEYMINTYNCNLRKK